jgi:hypothetical protein
VPIKNGELIAQKSLCCRKFIAERLLQGDSRSIAKNANIFYVLPLLACLNWSAVTRFKCSFDRRKDWENDRILHEQTEVIWLIKMFSLLSCVECLIPRY